MTYPDPNADYILDTDASGVGIGAVLSQTIEGQEKVIAYASRALSKPERNYCVTRRELLAVIVFLKQFRQYLYGRRITIRTDHGALRWLINFRDPQGQMARWLQVLGEYDFTIIHRAGRSHGNADGLSRKACAQCGRVDLKEEPLKESQASEPTEHVTLKETGVRVVTAEPSITREKLRGAQMNDQTIRWVLEAREKSATRPGWDTLSPCPRAMKSYWLLWDQLQVKDGVLCRRWESDDGRQIQWKVVLPITYRKEIINELHGGKSGGHLGLTKTMAKVRQRFYWAGMGADVRSAVRQCNACASKKSPARKRKAPLRQLIVGAPMERIALDMVGPLPETVRGNRYILVVGDYFSKWVEAYPVPNEKATTVAEKLVEEFVCRFGVPDQLHSDQGRNFESEVFSEMCTTLGIEKTRTTPYNPKSDGMIERFNRTLLTMVSLMIEPHKRQRDWDTKLPYATFAYRSTPQESTGESPNMLMLGREVKLPIDLTTELPKGENEELTTDYALRLRESIKSAHDRARNCLKQSARRQKRNYDRRVKEQKLAKGQFVWLHNPARTRNLTPKLQFSVNGKAHF